MLDVVGNNTRFRIGLFVLLLFVFVLLPFFLLEEQGVVLSTRLLADQQSYFIVFALVIAGLALDIFLPLPSTIIAASGASLLGGMPAFLAVWMGLSLGCLLGLRIRRDGRAGDTQPYDQRPPNQATYLDGKSLGAWCISRI